MREEHDAATEGITVRLADRADLPAAMNVLDGALLDVDASEVRERIDAGNVFLASEAKRVRGTLVLSEREPEPESGIDGRASEVEAIAVRRRYRSRGIASALIERARRESDRVLLGEFDERVRPFYAALGFRIEPVGNGRFRGYDTRSHGRE